MEEVWKDIHQSSIQVNNNNPRIGRGHHRFEEVLSRAPIQSIGENDKEMKENQHVMEEEDKNGVFKKELLMSSVIGRPNFMSSFNNSPFEALATNTVVASTSPHSSSLLNPRCFPIVTNKRPMPECHHDVIDVESGVDRRHKRMLKNRESAARSRARRQAYTTELEREHAELKEENAKLRKQQEQLLLSASAQVVPKKRTHNRSFTAPF